MNDDRAPATGAPPSDGELAAWMPVMAHSYRAEQMQRLIAEVRRLRAKLARRPIPLRRGSDPFLKSEDHVPEPPARSFGLPTCPNGCDPSGRDVIFGAHSWNCGRCGVELCYE